MSEVRRGFTLVCALALLAALEAFAQAGRPHRVAYIDSPTPEGKVLFSTFRTAMRELGYAEGRNVVYVTRTLDHDAQKLAKLVEELLGEKPDLLLGSENVALAMRAKTTTIPIVLTNALDPVSAGLAVSLRRPGRNVTGSAQLNDLLPAKHVEIMREILPGLKLVGQLVDTNATGCRIVETAAAQAARSVGATLASYYIKDRSGIERAFLQMAKSRPDVVLPCPSLVLYNHRDLLFERAAHLGVPLTSFVVSNVPKGVLFAYAADIDDLHRKAATFADKILKGANPGDLPIEQPTKFELVINLRTARAVGLTVPPSVLLRADRVIE